MSVCGGGGGGQIQEGSQGPPWRLNLPPELQAMQPFPTVNLECTVYL